MSVMSANQIMDTDSADEVFEDAEDTSYSSDLCTNKQSSQLCDEFNSSMSIVSTSSGAHTSSSVSIETVSPIDITKGAYHSTFNRDGVTAPNLEESLHDVMLLLNMALNNRFSEALEVSNKWAHTSLYHALGTATLGFLKGILTLEKNEIDNSMAALKNLVEVCSRYRRSLSTFTRIVWKPNYNSYTDEEAHAELVYAEALLMISLMTFLGDQNLINLVKGAFRIRSCFQTYKECAQIAGERTSWSSEHSRVHFESGVKMGIGTFNLMISHMPSKILKILEVLGFSGNRSTGFNQLEAACEMTDGLRSPLALLIAMTYHCYVEHYFGTGDGDIEYVSNLLEKALTIYPHSAFFLLFAGRVAQLKGNLDEALGHFDSCINVQSEWHQLHNVCHWESMWCRAIQCNWQSAAEYADLLRINCKWSPATYTYQYATFLYQIYEEKSTQCIDNGTKLTSELIELKEKIDQLINSVPSLRIRYAGKTVPCEKFAIVKCEKYYHADVNGSLCMPALEFIYVWNMFTIMDRADHKYVRQILQKVESNISRYALDDDDCEEAVEAVASSVHDEQNTLDDNQIDRYALCLMLKGVCLRTLGSPDEAKEYFLKIIEHQDQLVANVYLAPHSCMELGLTFAGQGDYTQAKQWLERARKDYTGYLYETIVHFRVHCALRSIKAKEKSSNNLQTDERVKEKPSLPPTVETFDRDKTKITVDDKVHQCMQTSTSLSSNSTSFTEMAKAMHANCDANGDAMDRLLGL